MAAPAEAGVVAPDLLLSDDRVPVLGDVVDAGVAGHERAPVVRLGDHRRERGQAVHEPRHHLADVRLVGSVVVGLRVDGLFLLRPPVPDQDLAADIRPAVEPLRHVGDDGEVGELLAVFERRRIEYGLVLPAERNRVVDPDHAADPVAPGTAGIDDDARRNLPIARHDTGDAPVHGRDAQHLAALVDEQSVPLGGADERLDREHRIGKPGRWLVARERHSVESELRPAPGHLVRREERGLDTEALLDGDHLAQRLLALGRGEQHVADLVEPGRPAELLLGVGDHGGTTEGQPDPDLVGVVLPHVCGRVLGRAAADLPLLDQDDLPEAALGQKMGGARPHDPSADHDCVGFPDHVCLLSLRRAAVASSSAAPSTPITTPYSSDAADVLTFSFATSWATASGSRSNGSPQPPPPAIWCA